MLKLLKTLIKQIETKRYYGGWIDYPGVGRIYDKDVARYAAKHLHWWDRLDIRKVTDAVLCSQTILMEVAAPEEFSNGKKNWKF